MFRPRIIPVLLLKNKGLVKTVQFNKKTAKYIGDPINAVRIFNDLNCDEIIFLDIFASKESRVISKELIKSIAEEAFMPFAVGGGIKNVEDAIDLLKMGAEKIIINTAFHENPDLIRKLSDVAGSQSVVISIDVKRNIMGKYRVFYKCGEKLSSMPYLDVCKKAVDCGAGELFINSINNDGKMNGYDLEMINNVSIQVPVPVIACGGAGNLTDLKNVVTQGKASAAAAGSIFVLHGERKTVLINYPNQQEMKSLFFENNLST